MAAAIHGALLTPISCNLKQILSQTHAYQEGITHLTSILFSSLPTEVDDEGIERDSEEIDDEKFVDSKELDHILEVSLHKTNFYCYFKAIFVTPLIFGCQVKNLQPKIPNH
jgi:hypothetical protein